MATFSGIDGATSSESEWFGFGVVQEIDAAAMSVWIRFRETQFEDNSTIEYEDFDEVTFGGLINF